MLFRWAEVPGHFDKTGIDLNLYFLLALWVYPTVRAVKNQSINSTIAYITTFVGFLFLIVSYFIIDNKKFVGVGFGWSLFMIAVALLSLGLLIYIITTLAHKRNSRDAEAKVQANASGASTTGAQKESPSRFSPASIFEKVFGNVVNPEPTIDPNTKPIEVEANQGDFEQIKKVLIEQSDSINLLHTRYEELAADHEKLAAGFAELAIELKSQKIYANRLAIATGLILILVAVASIFLTSNELDYGSGNHRSLFSARNPVTVHRHSWRIHRINSHVCAAPPHRGGTGKNQFLTRPLLDTTNAPSREYPVATHRIITVDGLPDRDHSADFDKFLFSWFLPGTGTIPGVPLHQHLRLFSRTAASLRIPVHGLFRHPEIPAGSRTNLATSSDRHTAFSTGPISHRGHEPGSILGHILHLPGNHLFRVDRASPWSQ
jgi:uncharacterized membrane protein